MKTKKTKVLAGLSRILSKPDLFKASLFLMAFLVAGVFFSFPFDWILLVPGAFFLPGFLFTTLLLKNPGPGETILYSTVFSFAFIALPLMVLVYNFDLTIQRELVLQIALATSALFLGLKRLRRYLDE